MPGGRRGQPGPERGAGAGQPRGSARAALRAAAGHGSALGNPTHENVNCLSDYRFFDGFPLRGRCESAEPAPVFARLLDCGLRSTLAAAETALLLVTRLLGARFAMRLLLSVAIHHIASHVDWRWILPNDKRKDC